MVPYTSLHMRVKGNVGALVEIGNILQVADRIKVETVMRLDEGVFYVPNISASEQKNSEK